MLYRPLRKNTIHQILAMKHKISHIIAGNILRNLMNSTTIVWRRFPCWTNSRPGRGGGVSMFCPTKHGKIVMKLIQWLSIQIVIHGLHDYAISWTLQIIFWIPYLPSLTPQKCWSSRFEYGLVNKQDQLTAGDHQQLAQWQMQCWSWFCRYKSRRCLGMCWSI